jgi:hypothetical protein
LKSTFPALFLLLRSNLDIWKCHIVPWIIVSFVAREIWLWRSRFKIVFSNFYNSASILTLVAPLGHLWFGSNWAIAFRWQRPIWRVRARQTHSAIHTKPHLLILDKLLIRVDFRPAFDWAYATLRRVARLAERAWFSLVDCNICAFIRAGHDIRIRSVLFSGMSHNSVA